MKIGIDVSQLAYENTGVASFLSKLVINLIENDSKNQYVLFFSSLRKNFKFPFGLAQGGQISNFKSNPNVQIKKFRIPPTLLNLMWNKLHLMPIENFVGPVDVFITSDWTEPPAKKAKKATIIYDLIVYKHPEETHNQTEFNPFKLIISPNIVSSQKQKLNWVKKESDLVFTISKSSKKDIEEILGIDSSKIKVIYPAV
ncbi:MAG: hypothetical protein COU25_04005 [Candidatus Levybacteria bacterium CG10_big_fil_rev_8_21_14_0_10_35_13]|nr:MAG: hypothetical protein COU25_04005 [Candidatus Levybacteria bacterium CG10_big_fil_rev_8_21_14_0_10_35_13]